MKHIERFAPSPTGPLHLGHAFSALTAWDRSLEESGGFLLRIEDIDQSRARPKWETQIYEDLEWLEIQWSKPVLRQSNRMDAYQKVLTSLWDRGLLYSCTCTRRDIEDANSAPQEGVPAHGPDGQIYPGTCRPSMPTSTVEIPENTALRLNMSQAQRALGDRLGFNETGPENNGWHDITSIDHENEIGDIVLARKDMGTSYHLSVVLDDAFQNVTHVTRGEDLFEATKIHVVLQNLLGLPTPTYHHHRLIRDESGKRLAKRDDARAISKFRSEGASPQDIRDMVGLPPS